MTTLARIRSRCFGFEMLVHLYNHPLATYPLIHRVICIADILSLNHRTLAFRYGSISISDPIPNTLEHIYIPILFPRYFDLPLPYSLTSLIRPSYGVSQGFAFNFSFRTQDKYTALTLSYKALLVSNIVSL